MVKISGTTIRMTRGDTLRVYVQTKDEYGHDYIPQEGDSIRFAVKEDYDDETPLILKDIPIDTLILELKPEDTKNLDMRGHYVYDIELTYANGDVDTFINKAKLIMTEEVH